MTRADELGSCRLVGGRSIAETIEQVVSSLVDAKPMRCLNQEEMKDHQVKGLCFDFMGPLFKGTIAFGWS